MSEEAINGNPHHEVYVRRLQAKFGLPCAVCVKKGYRQNPYILLPQQRCKFHPDYVDPRPLLTLEQKKTCREITRV